MHSYISPIPRVILIKEALTDNVSNQTFWVPLIDDIPLKSRSTLNRDTLEPFEDMMSYEVSCTTLDSIVFTKQINPLSVGIVKIDVEGNELKTLMGGREFLQATNATLLIEIEARHHINDSFRDIFDFLTEFNFVPHYLCRVDCELKNFVIDDLEKFQSIEKLGTIDYVNNFIFIKSS